MAFGRYYLKYRSKNGPHGRYSNPTRTEWLRGAKSLEEAIDKADAFCFDGLKEKYPIRIIRKDTVIEYEYPNGVPKST